MQLIIFLLLTLTSCSSTEFNKQNPDWSKLTIQLKKGLLKVPYEPAPKKLFSKLKASKNTKRWCFLGDTGVEGRTQKQVSEILLKQTAQCDRIYHLGDMVYPTGIQSTTDPELEKKFIKYHSPFAVPFQFVLGDHEYYAQTIEPWREVAKKYENLNFPYYYYGEDLGGICVVAGDTTPYYRGKESDPKPRQQSHWFEKDLPRYLEDCNFKIFIAHHSYATINKKRRPPTEEYKKPLRNFFEKYILGEFDMIVSGHDHALAYVGNYQGTDQYISGAGGKFTSLTDERMDLDHHQGHKGPGIIYLEIKSRKPFKGIVRIVVLEGKNLDQPKTVYLKHYR